MHRRSSFTSLFVFLIILSAGFFLLGKIGALGFLEKGLQSVQKPTFGVFNFFGKAGENERIKKLEEENLNLSKQLIDQKKLEADIQAFRNQFETEEVRSNLLLPAEILGIKGFVPNLTAPEFYTIDKGRQDSIKEGDAIVFDQNLVGKVERVSVYQSRVLLPTNSSFSLPAKTQSGVLGVIKGQGNGEMILENVLLSEILNAGDLVLTAADADLDGGGATPDLIIGKIVSIERKEGELFQKARIKNLVDYTKLSRVFVLRPR